MKDQESDVIRKAGGASDALVSRRDQTAIGDEVHRGVDHHKEVSCSTARLTDAVQALLGSFDRLSVDERYAFSVEILRRTLDRDVPPLNDDALDRIAAESFQEYDQREPADAYLLERRGLADRSRLRGQDQTLLNHEYSTPG